MTQVTQNQALERWDLIPVNLREALVSETNSEFLWKISHEENVPEEKIYIISQIAGYVLLGFIHPEDVARELKERLTLDQKTSSDIEAELNKRIFAPLRADIDKVYKPISKLEAASAPKIIQDIGLQKVTGPLSVSARPIQGIPPVPPAPKPSLADKGWSKMSPSDPMIKLAPAQAAAPMPPKPPAPSTPQQKPPAPAAMQSSTGEFARFAQSQPPMPSAPKPPMPPASVASKPPAAPAPMMLHEDPGIKSIKGSSDFRIAMSYQEGNLMGTSKQTAPSKPAVIDFPGKPADKVVHYTEFKPSMPVPPTSSAGRSVTQITPPPAPKPTGFTSVPVPTPPQAPKPPAVPMPPKPPAPPASPSSQAKVINKDYV